MTPIQIVEDGMAYSNSIYQDAKNALFSGEISYLDFVTLTEMSFDIFNVNYQQLQKILPPGSN